MSDNPTSLMPKTRRSARPKKKTEGKSTADDQSNIPSLGDNPNTSLMPKLHHDRQRRTRHDRTRPKKTNRKSTTDDLKLHQTDQANKHAPPFDMKKEICTYAKEGNLTAIKDIFQQRQTLAKTIIASDTGGGEALLLASASGHLDVVEWLVKKGKADVEARKKDNKSPLHLASYFGHLDVVEWLVIQGGANIEVEDNYGYTPLHYASTNRQRDVVSFLSVEFERASAEVNKKQKKRANELKQQQQIASVPMSSLPEEKSKQAKRGHPQEDSAVFAEANKKLSKELKQLICQFAEEGHLSDIKLIAKKYPDMAKKILASNASKFSLGRTPLHNACRNGHLGVVMWLVEEGNTNVEAKSIDGYTPLHLSCLAGQDDVVKWLVTKGKANMKVTDNIGRDPLSIASEEGHSNIMFFLKLKERHDKNFIEQQISTFVKWGMLSAIQEIAQNHPEMVQKMLATDAGEKALHTACWNGHLDDVQWLVTQAKINVETKNKSGATPLHTACWNGQLSVVEWLVTGGKANVEAKNNDEVTPLHLACCNGHLDVVGWLLSHGKVDLEQQISTYIKEGNLRAIKKIGSVDPELVHTIIVSNAGGWNPLHIACENGHLNIVEWLVTRAKMNVEINNKYGATPLHAACANGQLGVVEWLVMQGKAKVNATTKDGNDSLGLASKNGHSDVVSYLKEYIERTTIPPHCWCISYQQLLEVEEEAKNLFGDTAFPGKTMRNICSSIIEPICDKTGTSYALHLNPEGLPVDVFISHSWDGQFAAFVKSIKTAFKNSTQKPNLWICAFALVQGGNEELISQQVGSSEESLEVSPFVQALKAASIYCVVRNSCTDIYSRIWCVCELMYASHYNLFPGQTRVAGPDQFAQMKTSVLDAQASRLEDRDRILRVLLTEFNRGEIDEIVHELRTQSGIC